MTIKTLTTNGKDINQLWEDHKRLVYHILQQYSKAHGHWDWEDMVQDAAVHFSEAVNKWEPEKGKLTTWLWYHIPMRLHKENRMHRRWQNTSQPLLHCNLLQSRDTFNPDRFLMEVSEDAQTVTKSVMEMPNDLKWNIIQRGKGKRGSSIRISLKKYLQDSGWEKSRITSTFQEISEALV